MIEIDTRMLHRLISSQCVIYRLIIFFLYWILSLKVEPIAAGVLASLGGVLGKLSGSRDVVGDSYILWVLILILMIIFNTWGCRCYLRALDASPDTVTATVISSAVSYFFSALIEVKFFDGNTSLKWWIGNVFILQGIALLANFKSPPCNDDGILSDSNNNGNLLDDDDDDRSDYGGDVDNNRGDNGGGVDDDGGDYGGVIIDDRGYYGGEDDEEYQQFVHNIEHFFPINDEQLVDNIGHYFKDRRRLG